MPEDSLDVAKQERVHQEWLKGLSSCLPDKEKQETGLQAQFGGTYFFSLHLVGEDQRIRSSRPLSATW